MKKVSLAVLLAVPVLANAATPGFFAGVQGGVGNVNTKAYKNVFNANYELIQSHVETGQTVIAATKKMDENGFSGRIFGGYNFNEYVSVEAGYTQFAQNQYDFLVAVRSPMEVEENRLNGKFTTSAWDISGKAFLPLKHFSPVLAPVNLYAKLGVAYVIQKIKSEGKTITYPAVGPATTDNINVQDFTNRKWRPVFGVGASYNINNALSLDISWTRVQGGNAGSISTGTFSGFTATSDLTAVGLTYHFN